MNSPRPSLILAFALLSTLHVAAAATLQADVRTLTDLPYHGDGATTAYERERCKLDLYLPAAEPGFATLVWFHGGGLQAGDKSGEMTVRIAKRLAASGIAVVTPNYRLSPAVTYPVYIEDAASSVAWVRAHIAEHGGDPQKVFVSGHSAGGYLTSMIGLDARYLRRHGRGTDAIAGLIPVSGQMVTHSTVRQERGIPRTRPLIDAAAPSFHARADAPPVLAICGGDDLPARAAESHYFVEVMKAAGHEDVACLEVAGRDHSTIVSRIPEADDVVAAAILAFIAKHSDVAARRTSTSRAISPPIAHRLLAADSSKRRIAIIAADGSTEWEHEIGPLHDLHLLPSGHVLFQTSWTRIVEVDPASGDTVWEYDAARRNATPGDSVEVHAFQRLPDGLTMVAESGRARIIEVDRDGSIVRQIRLKIDRPDPHRDTRLVRKLDTGNYLVSHEALGVIREYDANGAIVWEYAVPLFGKEPRGGHGLDAFGNAAFCAVRLDGGNTLIATGNGHSVLEVTPAKEIVWSLHQDDLPGVRLAWVTTLEVLPNGHIVLGNCHAGPDNPQVIEITRDKEVVWSFKDFDRFGNALSNSKVLATR